MAVRAVSRPAFGLKLSGFKLDFRSDSPGIISTLAARYGRFRVAARGGLRIEAAEAPGSGLPFKPSALYESGVLELSRGDFRASLDLRSGAARLEASATEQCLDAFLRTLLSSLLSRSGGAMLHSACILKAGLAHLFLGKSGAGKSTLARLAAGAGCEVVSDEINMLNRSGNGFVARGSPFWGEMRADGRPGKWPLAGIYALRRGRANLLRPGPAADFTPLFLRCCLNFSKEPAAAAGLLDAAAAMRSSYKGEFFFSRKDASFLRLLK